jgi:molecular chaperone HscB
MYYFELFDTPISLVVDKSTLLKKYYALSKEYHPDNFSLGNESAQEHALNMSAKVNEAKKILDNSYKRLEYILRETNTIIPDEKYVLSPQFLGDMMDINEQLLELEFDKNEAAIAKIKDELVEIEASIFASVQSFFTMPLLEASTSDYQLLKDFYYKKKYIDRVKEKVESS